MKPDQERVKNLLTDTVTLLCKNGLHYQKELKVQGLLGITTDEDEVFIVHINEKFGDLVGSVGISINTQDNDAVSDIALSTAALANASTRDKTPKKDRHVDLTERKEPHHHRFAERIRNRKRPSEDSSSPCVSSPISSPRATSHSQTSRSGQPSPSFTTSTPRHHDDISSTQSPADPLSAAQPTIKIKKEEDVIIIDKNSYCQEGGSQGSDTNIPRHGEADAMQQNYGGTMGLSLEEIQSGFPQFEAIDSSLQNDVKPPPAKRRVSSTVAGSSGEHISGEVGPGVGVGGPFITGMVQNVRSQGELEDSQTSGTSWDNSSLGPLTQDGQVLLEGAPGCSTWDSSQMQMSVMRSQGATGQTGESSESSRGRFPANQLANPIIRDALVDHLIRQLAYGVHHVTSLRVIWRMGDLSAAWTEVVRSREECDAMVKSFPAVYFFFSSITGVRTHGSKKGQSSTIVYPGLSYWIVSDASELQTGQGRDVELRRSFKATCPTAEVKMISPRQAETSLLGQSSSLFAALKDHTSCFIKSKIEDCKRLSGHLGHISAVRLTVVDPGHVELIEEASKHLKCVGLETDLEFPPTEISSYQ